MPEVARSFADVVASLLDDTGRLVKFLLLAVALCLLAWGFAWTLLRSVPSQVTQINLGSSQVLLTQTTKQGTEYLVVVHPQGWQETGIQVREGDTLHFHAYGSVHVDLGGLVNSVQERIKAEDRIVAAERKLGKWEEEKGVFLPERHFTEDEKQKSRPRWEWTGPNGNPKNAPPALPARQSLTILPKYGYGALLCAIRETGVVPARDDALFVGTQNDIKATKSGKVYFTVNDAWDDNDPSFPDKFFVDNVGFFYATVQVTPPK